MCVCERDTEREREKVREREREREVGRGPIQEKRFVLFMTINELTLR